MASSLSSKPISLTVTVCNPSESLPILHDIMKVPTFSSVSLLKFKWIGRRSIVRAAGGEKFIEEVQKRGAIVAFEEEEG